MGNEEFLALYNQTLADWKEKIFTDGLADTIVDYYVDVFYSYNDYADLVDKETYDKNVEAVRNFINGKK
jgi:spore coat protein CotH